MHALLIAVLVSVGIGNTALAQQQRSVRDVMNRPLRLPEDIA